MKTLGREGKEGKEEGRRKSKLGRWRMHSKKGGGGGRNRRQESGGRGEGWRESRNIGKGSKEEWGERDR